ncbi:MinD/ParA family protein [Oceanobacillus halophilus]|uniref:MinD/ParA family protein n=1 Tax=Oceanobacillus halophilus TaxID=930130 RepID=A0A495ACA5_9BACI|nr:MinD/ParA family protein [Oceanobacillus halophilus]RKQ37502.1 MinD/ParA family protein [Oceanobacillus halophilus]
MNDQAARLRRKIEMAKNPKHAKTLCVISGKGGVGKSNIALNFSLELMNKNKKVLLLDLDVGMGNIDILLGLNANKTILNMLNDDESIHNIIEVTNYGLAYIAAGSGLNEFLLMDDTKREYFLNQFSELTNLYDYIIFDMGAGLHSDSLFFVLAADECIVVTTPEPTSITDAYSAIKHIVNNKEDMPIQVIMNRSFSQKNGEQTLERFKQVVHQFLQVDILKMGILPEDKAVNTAVINQVPYIFNEKATITKAMKQITSNYLHNITDFESTNTPTTFIQKLKQLLTER